MDYQIFAVINSFAGQFGVVDELAKFCAVWLIFVLAILLLVSKQKWIMLRLASVSVVMAYAVNKVIGIIHFRARPFVDHQVNLLISHDSDKSFPSDHTTIAFAIATAIYIYNRKLGVIAYAMAFMVGLSRIFVGVHYPGDVLAGAMIGTLITLLFYLIFRKMTK